MGEDEQPPEWMWHLEHELEFWFKRVKEDRDEKYGRSSDDDKTVPMMSNEFAEGRR